ncbi:hypothetical protein OS493_019715 [Desmophyllum pertusum]|uniref:Uncharacterized protein n=1 Tax=Desmophyllum pertusum TaxID=174260 RepID=A0A9W9YZA4_9CNID|nr:hypothetical protein OS493_019715 [Desmophyllum pertusum]
MGKQVDGPTARSPLDHERVHVADEARMEHQQTSRSGAEFKSFLGEEGPHGPPLSSHLSTPQIKQQLFDFSLGKGLKCTIFRSSPFSGNDKKSW